jgi:hypothetical protein
MKNVACATVGSIFFLSTGWTLPARADSKLDEMLLKQTRELYAAVDSGDGAVWDKYLEPDIIYTKEDGTFSTKAELLKDIKPFPKQIWGKLAVKNFRTSTHGDVAVVSYLIDETEGYFGQVIKARYLSTDTWVKSPKGWRVIAMAALALRDDPPAIALEISKLEEYVGTYSLTSEVKYVIRREGDHLVGQRDQRKPESLKAEVADYLFVPGDPRIRKVFQRDSAGLITGFVERRETWDIRWKRE